VEATCDRRVLFITTDRVGDEMGGSAIRAFELARALAPNATVTLAAPGELPEEARATIEHAPWNPSDPGTIRRAIAAADVIVLPPQSARVRAYVRRSRARLVFDLYDPMPLEILELHLDASPLRRRIANSVALDHYLTALLDGDYFLCAGERQRDLWIGALLALRRITPSTYRADPTLRRLIDVVPFGAPDTPPSAPRGALRARFHGIRGDDEVILWNGGLHAWLDPLTAVRSMPALLRRRHQARLVFMGRPPVVPREQGVAHAARAEAERHRLLDKAVFFNDAWVPYRDRADWLVDAECTLCTYVDHLETRFSFRTRVLDSFWAGLPAVCTAGDELAARILDEDLGAIVPPGDADATADAVERVLRRGRDAYAPALRRAAADHAWHNVAAPLTRFVVERRGDPSRLRRRWRRSSQPSEVVRSLLARGAQVVNSQMRR
jgi:glycosyltransferase involved in cell wall biosynthesis